MTAGSKDRRAEQKLDTILAQVDSLRARLNGLALQQGLFSALALGLGTATLFLLAAFYLPPLGFLAVAAALVAVLLVGLVKAIGSAWGMLATLPGAAALADRRARLKGRLSTILAMADGHGSRSPLWPYLLEDTLLRGEEFAPSRIERRRVSRSLYPFLAATMLALAAVLALLSGRERRMAALAIPAQVTVDVNHLRIRPADPTVDSQQLDLSGSPRALDKLAQRLGAAGTRGTEPGRLSRLINRAQDLASNLQSRLTGQSSRRPPLRLALTDNGEGTPSKGPAAEKSDNASHERSGARAAHGSSGDQSPPQELASSDDGHSTPSTSALKGTDLPPTQGPGKGENAPAQTSSGAITKGKSPGSSGNGNAGSAHGPGSDPTGLFGQPMASRMATEGFKIAIEAEPSGQGQSDNSPSLVPPQVTVNLNPSQHPDEPLARASVPAADRVMVQRVFER